MSVFIILMNHNGKQPHSPATSKCKFNQHLQFDCFKTIKLKKLSFVGGNSPATSKCKFNQHLQFDCFKTIKLKKLSFVGGKFFPVMRRNVSSLFSMVHGKKMSSWKILN